jgi:hypothetical protein
MRKMSCLPALAAAAALVSAVRLQATSYTWNSTSSGLWSDTSATGWNSATYPHTTADTVTFSGALTTNATITLDVPNVQLSGLTFSYVAGNPRSGPWPRLILRPMR